MLKKTLSLNFNWSQNYAGLFTENRKGGGSTQYNPPSTQLRCALIKEEGCGRFWNLPICWSSSLHNRVLRFSFDTTRVISNKCSPIGTEGFFLLQLKERRKPPIIWFQNSIWQNYKSTVLSKNKMNFNWFLYFYLRNDKFLGPCVLVELSKECN